MFVAYTRAELVSIGNSPRNDCGMRYRSQKLSE